MEALGVSLMVREKLTMQEERETVRKLCLGVQKRWGKSNPQAIGSCCARIASPFTERWQAGPSLGW